MTLRTFLRHHSFPRFVLVGIAGFVVDGGLLSILHSALEMDVVLARSISFPVAVTATWYLNRVITFHRAKTTQRLREWGRYTVVAVLGGALPLVWRL